ncbi:MAG: DUF4340 domain-containing protein [Planctomycetota bacterium]|jgi:hypothetical protein
MSNRKLAILSVVAALMVVWVVVQSRMGHGPAKVPSGTTYLIQGLDTTKIARIIVGTGEDAVRLIWQDKHFVVRNKDNYPAEISKINKLITSCLDIVTARLITSNPANHDELQVSEKEAKSLVKFVGRNGQVITGVAVGKSDSQTRSPYVRLISSDDVYAATEAPQIRDSAMDYIAKEIVNISRDDVVKVTLNGPNDTYTLRVDDSNDDNIILDNIPEGKKLKTSDAEQVLSALSYVTFSDVKKESSEGGNLQFKHAYVCKSKDQIMYTFGIAKRAEKNYVKCTAKYVGETEIVVEKGKKSKEELKDKEAKFLAHDRANDFKNKHEGWLYELPEWKAANLTKGLPELLEDEKQEGEEEGADESPSASSND